MLVAGGRGRVLEQWSAWPAAVGRRGQRRTRARVDQVGGTGPAASEAGWRLTTGYEYGPGMSSSTRQAGLYPGDGVMTASDDETGADHMFLPSAVLY